MISPKGPEVEVISRQIANAHTTFNIVMTLIWTPLLFVMVKLVMRLIPDKKEGEGDPAEPVYLDDRLMAQPAAALQLAAKEILHLAFLVGEQLHLTTGMVRRKEEGQPAAGIEQREKLKGLGGKITEYLSGLFSAGVLTEEQAAQTAGVMYLLGDVERMGELCADVTLAIEDRDRRKTKYSKEAMKDLEKSLKVIEAMYGAALQVLTTGDEESARKIRKKKEKVLDLDIEMRKGHMDRVSKGKCATEMTGPLNDILHAIDRMGNCCVNIADAALDKVDLNYFNATGSPEELTAKE